MIEHDDLSAKPGWIRMSLHPIMTDEEIDIILDAIEELSINHAEWKKDYTYDPHNNYFIHNSTPESEKQMVTGWFEKL